jgi:aminoglycoside phosphotransferase family enzyme/predicted kinase
MALPDTLRSLLSPEAYPHPVRAVQLVETHISWILLTGDFAYKIKRPVQFAFVDQRTVQRRAFLCAEEVRLNRRFAADLYLEVCVITSAGSTTRLGGSGIVIEHAVKMRQFDRSNGLDELLENHAVEPRELESFGRDLARIHATLPAARRGEAWGQPDTVRAAMLRNLQECMEAVPDDAATRLPPMQRLLEQQLEAARGWMEERLESAKVRECHGDLHCSNIVRRDSRLTAFDCLEFEPAFRWIDVADEVAFLRADLAALDRPAHAQAFLGGYLAYSGDFAACMFLRTYEAHRSLVRAKVVSLSTPPTAVARRNTNVHLDCACRSLHPRRPALVLMCGLSGSGKTWLARKLAPELDAIHLRSDVERKRLSGLSETARTGSAIGQGLYSPDSNNRLYQHLAQAARSNVLGGFTTLVDATFGSRAERLQFRELARDLGVPVCVVHCNAPVELLRTRVSARQDAAMDASEADTSVLQWQEKQWETLGPDESLPVFEASTTDPDVTSLLRRQIATLLA